MKTGTVRYEVDPANLPPLTISQQAELHALAAMPDSDIDTSDIPPLPDTFWENGIRIAARMAAPQVEAPPPQAGWPD